MLVLSASVTRTLYILRSRNVLTYCKQCPRKSSWLLLVQVQAGDNNVLRVNSEVAGHGLDTYVFSWSRLGLAAAA